MFETKQSWVDSLLVYKDIRMLRILLLGAISGFPWVLIASSLSLWLKEEGVSRSTIGRGCHGAFRTMRCSSLTSI